MADPVQRALTQIAALVDDLRARMLVVESKLADLDRKHETVLGAQRTWGPVMVAREQLVIASAAAETASVPVSVIRTLHAGRELDVDVRDAGGEEIELVDARNRVIARLPRLAYVALPRVAAAPETHRLLGLGVRVRLDRTLRTAPRGSEPESAPSGQPASGNGRSGQPLDRVGPAPSGAEELP